MRVAVSASPLGYLRRGFRRFASCPDSEGRRGNSGRLFFKRPVSEGARAIARNSWDCKALRLDALVHNSRDLVLS